MSACSDAIDGSTPGLDPHEIVAEVIQLLFDSGLPGLTDRDDANDGGDPDRYSEDRQEASHLVPEKCHQGGPKQGRVVHDFLRRRLGSVRTNFKNSKWYGPSAPSNYR